MYTIGWGIDEPEVIIYKLFIYLVVITIFGRLLWFLKTKFREDLPSIFERTRKNYGSLKTRLSLLKDIFWFVISLSVMSFFLICAVAGAAGIPVESIYKSSGWPSAIFIAFAIMLVETYTFWSKNRGN